jgi:hypothetical protein
MTKLPSDEELLRLLGDRMDKIDLELIEAERTGDVSREIVAHRERARAWRDYAGFPRLRCLEASGAVLAARRNEDTAFQLEQDSR